MSSTMRTFSQIAVVVFSVVISSFVSSLPVKNSPTCGLLVDNTNNNNTFPWLVTIALDGDAESILCSGSAVSQFSAIFAASCLAEHADKPMSIILPLTNIKYQVNQIIVHQRFDPTKLQNLFDVAVVQITQNNPGFDNFACLPEVNDDPVGDCNESTYISPNESNENKFIAVGSPILFGPSNACLERRQLRGAINDEASILCAKVAKPCLDYGSQIFCTSPVSKDQLAVVGFGSYHPQFCTSGAYVRIAKYVEWILETIGNLEGQPIQSDIQVTSPSTIFLNTSDPCVSNPCGLHAVCWNSGSRFMCTCDTDFPEGNPYQECAKCTQDSHCNPGSETGPSKCVEKVCVEPPKTSDIPSEFVRSANGNYFYVSQEELPWPRAQYECLAKKGYLAELSDDSYPDDSLLNILRSANTSGSFWIGASDFEERGTFKWYYSGKEVSSSNWDQALVPNTNDDDRCLQVNLEVGGKWSVHNCSMKSRFICVHVASENESSFLGNSLSPSSSSATIRTERQQNFDTLNPSAHYASVCGRRFVRPREGRIVGGEVAPYGQWPWQVSLRQFKNGQYRHKCGAALLTHEWIITAAHCVKDVSASNLLVRIGEYNVLDTSEAHKHINRRITRVIIHNNFDKASYEYDIALLRVDELVSFQPNIVPICLPESDSDLVGEQGWVTGWGRKSEYGQISPILREVNLPIISNAKCMAMYKMSGQNEWIPRIFLCAGTPNGGQDSCEGDSGGPLTIKGPNGRFQLAGIISWGIGCGDRNRPGVYTRISEFRSWIKKNSNYEDFNR